MQASEYSRQWKRIAAAALLPAQLFVFNVVTVAADNEKYVGTPLLDLLALSMLPFLGLAVVLYLVSCSLTPRDRAPFSFILLSAFLLVWLQSQVLIWDYGGLTGEAIAWNDHWVRGVIDASIWVAAAAVLVVFYRRMRRLILNLALIIAVLQVGFCAFNLATAQLVGNERLQPEASLKEISRFSDTQNVIHLVVDGYQSDILEELLSIEAVGAAYRERLRGFTFYRENLGIFPYTQFSVPAYLSARIYRNDAQKEAFIDGALADRSIMSAAKKNGYTVDLAPNGSYFTRRHASLPHDHLIDIDTVAAAQDKFTDAALLWDISLFRSVPHYIKPLIYNDQKWLISQSLHTDPKYNYKYFLHTAFMNMLGEAMSASRAAPVYKLIHIHNTHRPMIVDERCQYAGGTLRDSRTTLAIQTACTMDTVLNFFERLKELGIYDSSLIVVHADHGGWVPTLRQGATIPIGDKAAPEWALSLASPLLMVKPPHARGELAVSNARTSILDIPDTVSSVMGWETKFGYESVFDLEETTDRERRFMFYFWDRNEWSNDYTRPITEYVIRGSHFETEWKPVETYSSEAGLQPEP